MHDQLAHRVAYTTLVVQMDLITFIGLFTNKMNKKPPNGTLIHVPPVVQASWQPDTQITAPL